LDLTPKTIEAAKWSLVGTMTNSRQTRTIVDNNLVAHLIWCLSVLSMLLKYCTTIWGSQYKLLFV